jgi:hypothetical protein
MSDYENFFYSTIDGRIYKIVLDINNLKNSLVELKLDVKNLRFRYKDYISLDNFYNSNSSVR